MAFRPILPPTSVPVFARARTRPTPRSTDDADSGTPPPADPLPTKLVKRRHHKTDRTGPNWDDNGDYLVGKYRPPKDGQWIKGQSGNPKGPARKEPKDRLTEFYDEVLANFTARVNGQEVQVNLGSFVVQLIKANAVKGTVRSQQILLDLFLNAVQQRVQRGGAPELEDWEHQLLDQIAEAYDLPAQPVVRNPRDPSDPTGAVV